jgi:hypothetical protein
MDFEMDYQPSKKEPEPKKTIRLSQPSATGSETQRPNGPSRRSTADGSKASSSHQQGVKDQKSTAQAAPATAGNGPGSSQPASKKRKSAVQSGNSTPTSQTNQAGASSKRSSSLAQRHNSPFPISETNLLTFTNCDAKPKDGKLVADDGTVLAPNGTLQIPR